MPSTKTNEMAFNVHLFDVLRTKHPRWRDHAGVEQTGVFRDAALQPDLVIRPPGGVPVVIETEFEPARSVEKDALARLGQRLQYNGDLIEQTIAIKVPKDLRRVQQGDLSHHIKAAEFHYCTYSGQEAVKAVRWPAEGWLVGSVDDMAGCIENVSLSERLLAEERRFWNRVLAKPLARYAKRQVSTHWQKSPNRFIKRMASKPRAWLWPLSLTPSFFILRLLKRTVSQPLTNCVFLGATTSVRAVC